MTPNNTENILAQTTCDSDDAVQTRVIVRVADHGSPSIAALSDKNPSL